MKIRDRRASHVGDTDIDGPSLTSYELLVDNEPDFVDTGLVDEYGNTIRRLKRGPIGFRMER